MLINLFLDYIVYITRSAAIGISTEIYQHAFNSLQGAIIDRDNFFYFTRFRLFGRYPGGYPDSGQRASG